MTIVGLGKHESDIVVSLGEIRAQPNRLAELRQHLLAVGTLVPEKQPKQVVGVRPVCLCAQRLAKAADRCVPIGQRPRRSHREIQPRLKLSDCSIKIARAQKDQSEIHIVGGKRRLQGDGMLQVAARILQLPALAQGRSEKGATWAGRGIQSDRFTQLRDRFRLRPTVPERYAKVVKCVGNVGAERHRFFQVAQRGNQISLLPQDVAQQILRVAGTGILVDGFLKPPLRFLEIALRSRILAALVELVRRTRRDRPWLRHRSRLLLQCRTQRVIALAELRIDPHRVLEGLDGPGKVAALLQRLAEHEAGIRVVGFVLHNKPQVGQSALGVALCPQRHAQVHVRDGTVRLQRHRGLKNFHRFRQLAILGECRSQIRVSPRVFRVEGDGLAELGDRPSEVPLFQDGYPQPVVGFGRSGTDFDRPLEGLERMQKVVSLPVRQSERNIELRIRRMLPDLVLDLADRCWPILAALRQAEEHRTRHQNNDANSARDG